MLEDVTLRPAGDLTISVVVPVYGCTECLRQLVDEVQTAVLQVAEDFELILVDDASGAWSEIQRLADTRPWLTGLRLSRNFGQHAAIYAGLAGARGEWVVVMDCDLQDPPVAIPMLYERALEDGVDVVFAQRRDRQDSARKRFASWAFYRTLAWLTSEPQDESIANFGIYRRPVIQAVLAMPERERIFPLMVRWTGFRTTAMPVAHAARPESTRSGYTFGKRLRLALGAALAYSDKPLRLVATSGMVCGLIAFVFVAVALLSFFTGRTTVAGYTSVMASLWLIGGLVLIGLGVVGLYVGQVFRNVQGRPAAIVAERT